MHAVVASATTASAATDKPAQDRPILNPQLAGYALGATRRVFERRTGPAIASPIGCALRAGEEPLRAACCAALDRLWPRPLCLQIENPGSNHPSRAETHAAR